MQVFSIRDGCITLHFNNIYTSPISFILLCIYIVIAILSAILARNIFGSLYAFKIFIAPVFFDEDIIVV